MTNFVTLPYLGVTAVLEKIFTIGGASPAEATAVAEGLVMANLSGHDSHGVIRTPRYVEAGISGTYVYCQNISAVIDTDSFALVDGNAGFGHWVGAQAVDLGIPRDESAEAIVRMYAEEHVIAQEVEAEPTAVPPWGR